MASNATRIARHRRAVGLGISVSVAAHVGALAIVTVPGPSGEGSESTAPRVYEDEFEAVEVVRLAEATPPAPVTPTATAPSMAAASTSTPRASAAAAPKSLDDRLAELSMAMPAARTPDAGRPVVTFRDLEPVTTEAAMMAAAAYGAALAEAEDEGGLWSDILGGISIALTGGGGHCPTPGAGPMILRERVTASPGPPASALGPLQLQALDLAVQRPRRDAEELRRTPLMPPGAL